MHGVKRGGDYCCSMVQYSEASQVEVTIANLTNNKLPNLILFWKIMASKIEISSPGFANIKRSLTLCSRVGVKKDRFGLLLEISTATNTWLEGS